MGHSGSGVQQKLVRVSGDFVLWQDFEELEQLLPYRIGWVKDQSLYCWNDD